ncbi:DUF814 domain-containing protein [Candidatus Woesearchaeota archaeon]|jgi:predicted ribosome quality control (RQC) complex YloA/Tae2 family protein|nr:DUF814 domain-containing protein [Candidatus Woesearchaeota archaeon]
MKIILKLNKTVQENAAIYFEKAKKAKKKLDGALEAIERSRKNLEKEKKKYEKDQEKEKVKPVKREVKKQWYNKFRWFVSSEGFLVIGGRDATSNEIVIKKHTDKEDVVFHTDMSGSPFFVVKSNTQINDEGKEVKATKKPTKITLQEVSDATASFSRAWKLGMSTLEVFHVTPEQVTKTANPGEFLPKGAFMIRGKTTYLKPTKMQVAVGIKETEEKGKKVIQVVSGPVSAISKQTKDFIVLEQGRDKVSDIAKTVRKKFGGELDDIIRALPSGGFRLKKR